MIWFLGFLWSLPGTVLALACLPFLPWGVSARCANGVLWLVCPKWPKLGTTFGHVIITNTTPSPRLITHELVHVKQWRAWGPIFLFAYPLASLWALMSGKRAYRDNAFEIVAYDAETLV